MTTSQLTARLAGAIGLCSAIAYAPGCREEFLEPEIPGALTAEVLESPAGIEGAVIGAYAPLAGIVSGEFQASNSRLGTSYNYVSGSMRGGDANKGTEAGDFVAMEQVINYTLDPTNDLSGEKWRVFYEGVTRANNAIRIARASSDERVAEDFRRNMIAQATFLRAHYFFELHRHFGSIVYFDETIPQGELATLPNTNSLDAIAADFEAAVANLPETQSAVGMVNRSAAQAYLGKVYLYQERWEDALAQFASVIDAGVTSDGRALALVADYSQLFNAEFDNNTESIFAIQAAANTGSVNNANQVFDLIHLQSSPVGGCCGFWQPSFDLVNSHRTEDGLPLIDSYREGELIRTDLGIGSSDPSYEPGNEEVDPRLDHTVGRRGIPYLDWGPHPGAAWVRSQAYAGPFAPKKYIYYQGQAGTLQDGSSWTNGYTAVNFTVLRLADVLLMAAEANAELGNLEEARALVNQVRARAANEDAFVRFDDGTPAANYSISTYDDAWTDQAAALEAIYFERKIELAYEGERFFDLVRWGRDVAFLNGYIEFESRFIPTQFRGAVYNANEALLPIPQGQLDLQESLTQNPGYN